MCHYIFITQLLQKLITSSTRLQIIKCTCSTKQQKLFQMWENDTASLYFIVKINNYVWNIIHKHTKLNLIDRI